ncbi:hypothetical protein CI102_1131 [Trichoderma harzianum]|nr:hypothetical protein CI102_1131 [Trichoderma harzianum]
MQTRHNPQKQKPRPPIQQKHQKKHATWSCLCPISPSRVRRSEPTRHAKLRRLLDASPPDSLHVHQNCRDSRSQPRTVSGRLSGGGRSFAVLGITAQAVQFSERRPAGS